MTRKHKVDTYISRKDLAKSVHTVRVRAITNSKQIIANAASIAATLEESFTAVARAVVSFAETGHAPKLRDVEAAYTQLKKVTSDLKDTIGKQVSRVRNMADAMTKLSDSKPAQTQTTAQPSVDKLNKLVNAVEEFLSETAKAGAKVHPFADAVKMFLTGEMPQIQIRSAVIPSRGIASGKVKIKGGKR